MERRTGPARRRRHTITAGLYAALAGLTLMNVVLEVVSVKDPDDASRLVVAGLQAIVFSISIYLVPYHLVRASQVGPNGPMRP